MKWKPFKLLWWVWVAVAGCAGLASAAPTFYRVSIGPGSGPKGDYGQIIPGLKSHDGFSTVRNKPFFKGDLNDNGAPDIGDVIRSLQIAVGIGSDPTPYEWAAGDFNGTEA